MLNLLYKELRLAAHPTLYVFMCMGALLIIPSYPYGVVFLFGCLGPMITFMFGRETRDIYYTALLPVKKTDVVKSKCLMVAFSQIALLVIAVPFAVLTSFISPDGNMVGLNANVAYFGFGLMIFAVFNMFLFPEFFKTAHKVGKSFLISMIPVVVLIVCMELSSHIPFLSWIDGTDVASLIQQIPLLVVGILIYIIGIIIAYRLGSKRFENVDL